ncbi:MAG: universal stress protein [Gammaproteobacteria bacterium]|nr:universal stress protein [Gammaproteobacteria bacterium]
MTYRRILVNVGGAGADGVEVEAALCVATRFDAELVGLYVQSAIPAQYGDAMLVTPGLQREAERHWAADAARAKATFLGAVGTYRSATWHECVGDPGERVGIAARAADLAFLRQPARSGFPVRFADLAGHVVLTSGRPVVIVPEIGFPAGFGSRPLIAWNGSREAARAVLDAMPLLRAAVRIDVLNVVNGGTDSGGTKALEELLNAHGLCAKTHVTVGRDYSAADYILSIANDLGNDLLVMGAYGHSRACELMLGGVTRSVLSTASIPAFMAH